MQPELLSLKQFNLKDIGINQDSFFKDILPSFGNLPLDIYEKKRQQVSYLINKFPQHQVCLRRFLLDYFCSKASLRNINDILILLSDSELTELENMGEVRYRTIAKFEVLFHTVRVQQIKRIDAGAFIQKTSNNSDLRSLPRFYSEVSVEVAEHSDLKRVCQFVSLMVKKLNPDIRQLALTVHQVCVSVKQQQPFYLPDGIHQDGVDYVVSALPVVLENVSAPTSTVYDCREKPLYRTELKVGNALFHDDRIYKHSVSPLHATANIGRRCTLGFDIELH